MRIGVAGLGKMGAAIAQRLTDLGHQVTVWNRSAAKATPVVEAGATLATSPADLATKSEVILTIVTNAEAINAVYNGPEGLLSGDVAGKLFIEMSTVRPETEIALAKEVRAKGAAFVECPVGGTIGPAREGKLLGLMGAEDADAARARPLLEAMCRRLEHCGPVGAGSNMKLAVNLPLMVAWQAYGEAFALVQSLGYDPERLLSLFTDISATNNALKGRAPMIKKIMSGEDPGPVTFDIASATKDLQTMLAEGKARGLELPLVERAYACFSEATRDGWGEGDGSNMTVYWSRRGK
jgi:3-hydroxyisobutyrate dehydrogenase